MKIKLTESQLKRILNEVGGYDSVDMMASHGGLVHGEISMRTMNLIQMLQDISQKMMEGSLSKHELLVGTYNLNSAINEYMERINILSNEVYIDDDFKKIIGSFLGGLKKIHNYLRLLVDVSQKKEFSGMSGMGMDMTKDQLALNIAKKISPLQDHIEKIGDMIPTIVRRFTDRMNNLNEGNKKKTPEVDIEVIDDGSSIIDGFTINRDVITLKGKQGIGKLRGDLKIVFKNDPSFKIKDIGSVYFTYSDGEEVYTSRFPNQSEDHITFKNRQPNPMNIISIISLDVDALELDSEKETEELRDKGIYYVYDKTNIKLVTEGGTYKIILDLTGMVDTID